MKLKDLSLTERLILANQFNILAKVHPDEAEFYTRKAEILESGYEGLYSDIFSHFSDPVPASVTTEVHDILSMYRYITPAIKALSEEEQKEIDAERISFKGFDANNDPHYHVALFYVEKMRLSSVS